MCVCVCTEKTELCFFSEGSTREIATATVAKETASATTLGLRESLPPPFFGSTCFRGAAGQGPWALDPLQSLDRPLLQRRAGEAPRFAAPFAAEVFLGAAQARAAAARKPGSGPGGGRGRLRALRALPFLSRFSISSHFAGAGGPGLWLPSRSHRAHLGAPAVSGLRLWPPLFAPAGPPPPPAPAVKDYADRLRLKWCA